MDSGTTGYGQAETTWWLEPGDQELKEGSWLLDCAVRAAPSARDNKIVSELVASAVAAAATSEGQSWTRSIGLDGVLRLILVGEKDEAITQLAQIRRQRWRRSRMTSSGHEA